MVMTMRKTAVMRFSSVRTQAGGVGSTCRAWDVELLFLVMLFVVDVLGPDKAGADRDTSSNLCRCMRENIVAEVCRRGTETQ